MVVLNVLIAGIAYVGNNMIDSPKLNDKSFFVAEKRPRVNPMEHNRAEVVFDRYQTNKIDKFLLERLGHSPLNVMDYGSRSGYVGLTIAERLGAENLVLVDQAKETDMRAVEMADSSPRMKMTMVNSNEVPKTELFFDLIMLNDVVGLIDVEKSPGLFDGLVRKLSEQGVIVATQTDDTEYKMLNLRGVFEKLTLERPDLLKKIIFTLPTDELLTNNNDLGSDLLKYQQSSRKHFVMEQE